MYKQIVRDLREVHCGVWLDDDESLSFHRITTSFQSCLLKYLEQKPSIILYSLIVPTAVYEVKSKYCGRTCTIIPFDRKLVPLIFG